LREEREISVDTHDLKPILTEVRFLKMPMKPPKRQRASLAIGYARLLSVGLRESSDHRRHEAILVRMKIVASMIFPEHVQRILRQPVASVTPYLQ
jgi:hypothetical protein